MVRRAAAQNMTKTRDANTAARPTSGSMRENKLEGSHALPSSIPLTVSKTNAARERIWADRLKRVQVMLV
jgi:hypothetical protein